MRLIIIFIAFCTIRKSIQKVEFYEEKVPPMNEILCVNTVLEKYSNEHSGVVLYSRNSNSIVNMFSKVPLFLATGWDSARKILSGDRGALVIFLEGNADQDFNGLKPLQGFVFAKPVLIVCITDAICASDTYMKMIIEMVASAAEMRYVAIDERGIIDIYEYTRTAEGSCGIPQLSRLGHCSDESTAKKLLQTSINFHECPIRAISWNCPPYSEPCGSDDLDQFCGIEGNVVKVIAKRVNATPVIMRVQTPTDVKQLVAKRYADLGFGELSVEPYEGISYSISYLFLKATFIASPSTWGSDELLRNIFGLLKLEIWIGIVVVIASILILRILVTYFRRISLLQLFGILIAIPVPRPPQDLPIRIYFLSLMWFAYIYSQAYLGNLTRALTSPKKQMIETLHDLENSNIRVTGTSAAREKLMDDYPRIYNDFRSLDESLAKWKTLKVLENGLGLYPVAIATPNSSTIMKVTNRVLALITESGIIHEYVVLPSSKSFLTYKEPTSSEESLALKFHELQGVFLLLVVGLSLSFFVFLIEILTAFIKTKGWFNGRGTIHLKWLRQLRRAYEILRRRQTSPA